MRAGASFFLEGAAVVSAAGEALARTGVVRSIVRTGVGLYEVEISPTSASTSTMKVQPRGASQVCANLEIVSDILLRVRCVQ